LGLKRSEVRFRSSTSIKKGKILKAIKKLVLALAVASAAPAMAGMFTVSTSDNLAGQFSVYDGGERTYNTTSTFDVRNYQTVTSATVLGTFQDLATTQWYQTTQYTSTYSYDYSAQDYSRYEQYGYIAVNPVAGDQWTELSLTNTTGRSLNYQVYMNATAGSKTSPRGNTQTISPAFAVTSDATPASTSFYNSSPYISYYAYGSTDSEVRVVGEATDGGTLSSLQVYLSADTAIGTVRTEHVSYVSNQWTQNVAISAPVPEPETYAMLLAGLGVLGAVARRRKAQANA
jgi:hypothetical protein